MSKGSGGNRKSSSSRPAATSASLSSRKSTLAAAQKQAFTSDGLGTYVLETKHGGGQIDSSQSSSNLYKYGSEKVYHANPWDADYKMGQSKVFYTLNDAKKYIKSLLK